jgi:hypothetical protein
MTAVAFRPPLQKKKKNAPLDPATMARLANEFAGAILEMEFSVAALQGCECFFSSCFQNPSWSLCVWLAFQVVCWWRSVLG